MDKLFNYDLKGPPEKVWRNIEEKISVPRRNKYMKKTIFIVLSIILVGGIAGFLMLTPKEQGENIASTVQPSAVIKFVVGKVRIKRDNDFISAKLKTKLFNSDVISTGKNSEVHILVKNLGVFKIKADSEIKLVDLSRNSKIFLKKGKFLTALKKLSKKESFIVDTPTAVAGVRGTSFPVSAENKETKIFKIKG